MQHTKTTCTAVALSLADTAHEQRSIATAKRTFTNGREGSNSPLSSICRIGQKQPVEPDSQLSRNRTFVTVKPLLSEGNALMYPQRSSDGIYSYRSIISKERPR
jgi:hypothetical protein